MKTVDSKISIFNRLPIILTASFLYLCFWNWSDFSYVYLNGELGGPDDFLRMSQIHAWMQGQGWFDLTAYKMVPPHGGDIHWTRLIDVPIATLIYLFQIFLNFEKATNLAAIVWPLLLMLITLTIWTFICDRLLDNYPRWMPAFFGLLSISTINQFPVGRVDHHNVQILFFGLMILGLVNRDRKWGDYLIGFAIAFSMSVGAESLILTLFMLSIIGFEWAGSSSATGKGISKVGISLIMSTFVLYGLNFLPENYFIVAIDANSFFYLCAFVLIGVAFLMLGLLSNLTNGTDKIKTFILRILVGVGVAGLVLGILYFVFPDYLNNPYGNLSEELKTRWLNYVSEAKSLSLVLYDFPFHWLATVGYYLFMLSIGAIVLLNRKYANTKTVSLYIILFACVLGTLWQVRVIRTAALLVVPFCVIFSTICWSFLKEKYHEEKVFLYGFQTGVVMFQISIFWYIAGALFFPLQGDVKISTDTSNVPETLIARRQPAHCLVNTDFTFLKTLPTSNVVSDLTTSTALMFHTDHSVVSGPYHRNQQAILDTLDFMGTDETKAKTVAEKYQLAYLGFCIGKNANLARDYVSGSVTDKLLKGNIPDWLEEVSPQGDRLRVFKIITN